MIRIRLSCSAVAVRLDIDAIVRSAGWPVKPAAPPGEPPLCSWPPAARNDARSLGPLGIFDLSNPAANLRQSGLDRLVIGGSGDGLAFLHLQLGNERALGLEHSAPLVLAAVGFSVAR